MSKVVVGGTKFIGRDQYNYSHTVSERLPDDESLLLAGYMKMALEDAGWLDTYIKVQTDVLVT